MAAQRIVKTKKCSKCEETREVQMFSKWKHSPDGRAFHCKICTKEYRKNNAKKLAALKRSLQNRNKIDGIKEYGGKCSCCGEREITFLTIDHIHNDGVADRNRINKERNTNQRRTGKKLWGYLKSQGYPKDRYRLLCFNCNSGRAINNNICPHQNKLPEHKYENEELEYMWWL